VLVVPPGVLVSPEGVFPLSLQAPRNNVSPNTREKAVNFRLTTIPPKILKIFYTKSRRLTLYWSNTASKSFLN